MTVVWLAEEVSRRAARHRAGVHGTCCRTSPPFPRILRTSILTSSHMTNDHDQRGLRPVEFLVLAVLTDERLHGYGLVKAIEERSDGRFRVRPGNLYRVLDRLLERGLVSGEAAAGPSGGGERTRLFAITEAGRQTVADEARLLTDVIRASRSLSRLVGPSR